MFFEKFFWKICVAPLDKSHQLWYNNHKLIIYSPTCFTFFSFFTFSIIIISQNPPNINSFLIKKIKKVFEKYLTWRIKMWYNKRGYIYKKNKKNFTQLLNTNVCSLSQLLLSNICSPPPACGTDTDPAPQLPPKYSRGTGIRRLGYQDQFPWLRKKYPGRKICHKKKTSFSPGRGALLFDNYEIQGDRSPDPAL